MKFAGRSLSTRCRGADSDTPICSDLLADLMSATRRPKKVTLHLITASAAQVVEMARTLYALGHCTKRQLVTEHENRVNDRMRFRLRT